MQPPSGPGALDQLERARVVLDAVALLGLDVAGVHDLARLHVDTVVAAQEVDAPELVAHQERWERARLATLGLTLRPGELRQAVNDALAPRLPRAEMVRLRLLYQRADAVEPTLPRLPREPLPAPAALYLEAALAGKQDTAIEVVRQALRDLGSTGAVVAQVLQPAQAETGWLWEAGRIEIAQEHAVTAITQTCLGMLGTRLAAPAATGRRVVAAAVGDEGHELGLRMLATLLRERGWEVDYLGGGVPPADLVAHVARSRPDVLALSVTMFGHVRGTRELLEQLRRGEDTQDVKVLVGGRAFALAPDLVGQIGADGWATDAAEALELCEQWCAPSGGEPAEIDLAERYGFEERHREAALALLAEETGLSVDDLRHGLSRVRR